VAHIETHILTPPPPLSPPSRLSPLSPSPHSPPLDTSTEFLIESVDKHEMTPLHAACSREVCERNYWILEIIEKKNVKEKEDEKVFR